mgnify:CR=1 FL=1
MNPSPASAALAWLYVPFVTVVLTGYRGATEVGTAILKSPLNSGDFDTFVDFTEGGDGFADMTGLTSFKVAISSDTTEWFAWDLSLDSFTVDNIIAPGPSAPSATRTAPTRL